MKIGVVGCGLIGTRRARGASQAPGDEVLIVADVDLTRAQSLAAELGCLAVQDWQAVVNHPDLDAVVVATPNKYLAPVAVAALQRGKHVLCEKPPGRNYRETAQMVEAARVNQSLLKVGFNHRHHPAVWQAHELYLQGAIGPLYFIRAIYGHGGRPGYDKEWRGTADLSGGGELLDQGVHIIDLCRWFMGDFSQAFGATSTFYWDLGNFSNNDHLLNAEIPLVTALSGKISNNTQLEDNAYVVLRKSTGQTAQFQTSWTQWKNKFIFEIIGRDGYLIIDGLGGSYGLETLTVGRRRPESGPPIEERFEFPQPDGSWQAEWQEFTSAIRTGRQPLANGQDGLGTMRTIAAIYRSAREGRFVQIME